MCPKSWQSAASKKAKVFVSEFRESLQVNLGLELLFIFSARGTHVEAGNETPERVDPVEEVIGRVEHVDSVPEVVERVFVVVVVVREFPNEGPEKTLVDVESGEKGFRIETSCGVKKQIF